MSAIQTACYFLKLRSWLHCAIQARLVYTLLMLVSSLTHRLYWLPAIGTLALVMVGCCLFSCTLSVMPWNRTEPVSFDILRRVFLTPPVVGRILEPVADTGCPSGLCVIEARATGVYRSKSVA
jgi:hypothetical protein